MKDGVIKIKFRVDQKDEDDPSQGTVAMGTGYPAAVLSHFKQTMTVNLSDIVSDIAAYGGSMVVHVCGKYDLEFTREDFEAKHPDGPKEEGAKEEGSSWVH